MNPDPTWSWESVRAEPQVGEEPEAGQPQQSDARSSARADKPKRRRRHGPRTCRICLETVYPKYPENNGTLGMSSPFRPVYTSEDPELGRLLSPCKCKGTQKYVHEGCLNAWRASSPAQDRNFWHCPTCGYTYKLARLQWASLLGSRITQAVLTLVVFILGIFILGFIADPVFNLWLDPVGTIGDAIVADQDDWDTPFEEPTTWIEHFIKGFFSLGIVGLLKSTLVMSPWHWWHVRGGGGGRRRGNGRGRVENLSLIFVLVGAFAAIKGIWRLVRALSARVLLKMRDKVLDVGGDDDYEEQPPGANPDSTINDNELPSEGDATKDR